MPEFELALVVDGVDLSDDDVVNELVKAGLDDVTFGVRDGAHLVYAVREAPDFTAAVGELADQLEKAARGLSVVGIETDDLVTKSGAAAVLQRTRQSVHQHVAGSRGSGFPPVLTWVDGERAVWPAGDLRRWAGKEGAGSPDQEMALAALWFVRSAKHAASPGSGLSFIVGRLTAGADEATRHELSTWLHELADSVDA